MLVFIIKELNITNLFINNIFKIFFISCFIKVLSNKLNREVKKSLKESKQSFLIPNLPVLIRARPLKAVAFDAACIQISGICLAFRRRLIRADAFQRNHVLDAAAEQHQLGFQRIIGRPQSVFRP